MYAVSTSFVTIVIEGVNSCGAKFSITFPIEIKGHLEEIEKEIVNALGSSSSSFDLLVSEKGWRSADWTYY